MSDVRLEICGKCHMNNNGTCSKQRSGYAIKDFVYKEEWRIKGHVYKGCNCPTIVKSKSPESICPIGKF